MKASRLTPDAFLATKYSEDHESVQFDDETKIGTVTITEYAQTSLGDVVFVELPEEGSIVEKGGTYSIIQLFDSRTDVCHRLCWRCREREGRFRHRTLLLYVDTD